MDIHGLMEHQELPLEQLAPGKILYGGVGSGKSFVAMAYYVKKQAPKDLYIITTAKKRDSLDWMGEAARYGIGPTCETTTMGLLTVDSWNNIEKYLDVEDAFFIFDEQRLVGNGTWVKSFLKVAKKNDWIMLSATPGDTWLDYAPVFIANGYYKNITDFRMKHVVYEPFVRFPKVKMYLNSTKLELLRNEILVEMPYLKHTERILNWVDVTYDHHKLDQVLINRWNVFENRPIKDVAELFRVMRKVVNSDPSRLEMVKKLTQAHPKLIVFYNYNFELEALRTLSAFHNVAEWNGHRKQPIPDKDSWIYLVQYVSGAEGWNCTETNAMIMYSLTYSYKNWEQAQGRIDRLNTSFDKLYYYAFVSGAPSDRASKRALERKKNFNEQRFVADVLGIDLNFDDMEEDE
jgi:hypothetical protein